MATTNSQDSQYMPQAKENQFQTIVRAFEKGEWAKGLKMSEGLLKEYPDNGKLLSMHSILKYNIDHNKEEAEMGLKKGIVKGKRTALCWHLYGIFQRSLLKYVEAKKSFQMASMMDPKNLQILIDLSDLQAQIRDWTGYRISKQKLMNERSSTNVYWLGFACGYFFEEKFDKCIEVIDTYLGTLDANVTFEKQELLFLEATCYEKTGETKKAITLLEKNRDQIRNEDMWRERRGEAYFQLKDYAKSEAIWRELLERNCENRHYLDRIESCLLQGMVVQTADQKQTLIAAYKALLQQYPSSQMIHLKLLQWTEGAVFEMYLKSQLLKAVRKGIPSFFKSIRRILEEEPTKLTILKQLCEACLASVQQHGYIEEGSEEEPCVELWLEYLLAEVNDNQGETEKALEHIEKALLHTPTCYDVYVLKAKVLKHAGDWKKAADAMREGSTLDKADRYMNTKYVKYLLRIREVEKADEVVSYWTKADVPNRIELSSLQACWFEVLCGDAYYERKDYVHANKLYNEVLNHFTTFITDQHDFHGYVLRKASLTNYINIIRVIDDYYCHPYYRSAALGALRCALHLQNYDLNEYKKTFPQLDYAKIHKKGAEYKDDEDPNGLKLATHPLQDMMIVVKELLKYYKDDRECMKEVMKYAVEMKDLALCEEVVKNLDTYCHSPICAWNAMEQMKKRSLDVSGISIQREGMKESVSVLESKKLSDYIEACKCEEDGKSLLGALDNSDFSLQEAYAGYKQLKKLQMSETALNDYINRVSTTYIYFERFVECFS